MQRVPRRQRPECPSFLGVEMLRFSTTSDDDDDDGGPGVAALGSAGVPGSLCQAGLDSCCRSRKTQSQSQAQSRSQRADRMELRPRCKSPDGLGLGVRCEVQCDVRGC